MSKKKPATKSKKGTVKKVNPFEFKFNRVKHNVLGQKKNNNVTGHPGLSKKRANEQREKTLGVEHSRIGVVNKIVDRRLGEKDVSKTSEEKASLRFTAERMKNFKKNSKFNLNDDDTSDILTHGGDALTSIQKYDRTLPSDDEEEGTGALGAEIVKMAHFGGGDENETARQPKSRKDMIADLIAKTKMIRHEKQLIKEDQETLTESLDEKYKKLLEKVSSGFRPIGATKNEVTEKDDYDKLALQLKFDADAKATPTERMKSDEEKAIEEKSRLEELENSRISRMNAKENAKRHLPVDVDVDPNASRSKKKTKFELRFDESGQVIDKDKIEKNSLRKIKNDSDVSDDDIDDEDDEDLDDLINDSENEDEEVDEEDEAENEDIEESDVEEETERESEEEEEQTANTFIDKENFVSSDIPFVFNIPSKYDELVELLYKYNPKNVGIILDRIVTCNHPSLKEGNKESMMRLFLFCLRFYDEISKEQVTADKISICGIMIKSFYNIMKFNLEHSVRCVRAFGRTVWKSKNGEKRNKVVSFNLIAFLRLVAHLFPVSDAFHPVSSPAFMLAIHSLSNGLVTSLSALAKQLLLLITIADYIEDSQRYVPEAMAFIQGALTLAVEKPEILAPLNVFPISEPHNQMLLIRKKVDSEDSIKPLGLEEIFAVDKLEDNDTNRCRVLRILIECVRRFRVKYTVHEDTFTYLFTPIVILLKKIPTRLLTTSLAEDIDALIKSTEAECNSKSKFTQMSRIKTEKSMLKMLEPMFETNFDPERPRVSRDANRKGSATEKSKLQHLYKKEMRGAMKALRKDTTFLGRRQRREVAAKDRDRRDKTKRLMSDLQSQQGEWNKEMREGGKKKKK